MAEAEALPQLTRRREVGHASARSLLMTVLGEYVLPRDEPVWTATLVNALAPFDIEEKSARQALARTAGEGWLVSERVGRRARWSLSAPGRRLLTEGARRIYEFGARRRDWDQRWVVLIVSVPESKRELRHRLRTRLTWAGFGTPAAGVWISPDTDRQAEAERILGDLGVGSPMSFVAAYGEIGDVESMVERAWDLRRLDAAYREFVAEFAALRPVSGESALLAQTRLVHEWRRFPFLDPQLPAALLPRDWSGTQAATLFHDRHAEWRDAAQRHWNRLVTAQHAG